MVNPDMLHEEALTQEGLELVLCKTRQCVQWIQKERTRLGIDDLPIAYIGFTTTLSKEFKSKETTITETDKNWNGFLHVAGKSPFKNTIAVLIAWLQHPQWPQLVLTSYKHTLLDFILGRQGPNFVLPPNIKHIQADLSSSELAELQHGNGIHLCPSSMEGFGHTLNEGRATGALVITTDYPSMNEFSGTGVLIEPSHIKKWRNGFDHADVDVKGIAQAVEKVLAMTLEERAAIGGRAKKAFEDDRTQFQREMEKLSCMVHDCHQEDLKACSKQCGVVLE